MILSTPHMSAKTDNNKNGVDAMFKVGAHYGFIKSRRHPSVKSFIFGSKNRIEIFDLEKTEAQLNKALEFVKSVAEAGRPIVFASSKSESKNIVKKFAQSINVPYVAGRWIGGTFTNFSEIKRRIEKLLTLRSQKEKGELKKYTKKEQLLLDREMDKLTVMFDGITSVVGLPGALFVVDSKKEHIAVAEAHKLNIPTFAITDTNTDPTQVDFAIPANDDATKSIALIVETMIKAIEEGLSERKVDKELEKEKEAEAEESMEAGKEVSADAIGADVDVETEKAVVGKGRPRRTSTVPKVKKID